MLAAIGGLSFFSRSFSCFSLSSDMESSDQASNDPSSLQHSVQTLREDVSAVQSIVTDILTRFSSSSAPGKCFSSLRAWLWRVACTNLSHFLGGGAQFLSCMFAFRLRGGV